MPDEFTEVDRVLNSLSGGEQPPAASSAKTARFRPTRRPPMGLLELFDDDQRDAERFRIRQTVTSVGKSDCDICIPHDDLIAAKHISIIREQGSGGRWKWRLKAEGHGKLFVRVRRARLQDRAEFIAGSRQYQFRSGSTATDDAKQLLADRLSRGSIPNDSIPTGINCASIVPIDEGMRPLWLLGSEAWIGRSSDCALCVPDDIFLAPQHVRLTKEVGGQWQAQTHKVPNGLWIGVPYIKVQSTCTFQIGEQRLRFRVC